MEIIWILAILFLFVTLIFVGIAFAFPEWVGITGSVAKEFERQQRGDSAEPKSDSGSDAPSGPGSDAGSSKVSNSRKTPDV